MQKPRGKLGLRARRRVWWAATGASLALNGLLLAGLAFGVRSARPPPDSRAMDIRLIALPREIPAAPRPARRQGNAIRSASAPMQFTPREAPALAPSISAAGAQPAPEAQNTLRRFDLGCFGENVARLPAAERERCDVERWSRPKDGGDSGRFSPLSRLDPQKRADLDQTAANQAACLEYKRRQNAPMPWSLRDVLKNGFC